MRFGHLATQFDIRKCPASAPVQCMLHLPWLSTSTPWRSAAPSTSSSLRCVTGHFAAGGTSRRMILCLRLPLRRRRMRATTSLTPSTATWTVAGGRMPMAHARTTMNALPSMRRSCVRSTRSSLRVLRDCLTGAFCEHLLVSHLLACDSNRLGEVIRAANTFPLSLLSL